MRGQYYKVEGTSFFSNFSTAAISKAKEEAARLNKPVKILDENNSPLYSVDKKGKMVNA